jgi:hypothetical protein
LGTAGSKGRLRRPNSPTPQRGLERSSPKASMGLFSNGVRASLLLLRSKPKRTSWLCKDAAPVRSHRERRGEASSSPLVPVGKKEQEQERVGELGLRSLFACEAGPSLDFP